MKYLYATTLSFLLMISACAGGGGSQTGGSGNLVVWSIATVAGDASVSISYTNMTGATQYTLY
ncbi:MAG: hypothetical protein ACYTDT_02850, partial [Planctomycetota bacterium]